MVKDFAKIQARKYGLRVFFRETIEFPGQQTYGLDAFDGWELVAFPDGRVMDVIPLDAPVTPIQSSSIILPEAFA